MPYCQTTFKIHTPIALPYITWGLIQDSKNKKEGIPEVNLSLDCHPRISKLRKEILVEIRTTSRPSKLRQEEIPIVKFIIGQTSGKFRKIEKK